MYTLHKLLKGTWTERDKSSEFLTQKENEDIVNILASAGRGTPEGVRKKGVWGGGKGLVRDKGGL